MRSSMKAVTTMAVVLAVAMAGLCMIPATDADATGITAEEFKALADEQGRIVLGEDMVLSDELVLTDSIVLNLAGHGLTNAVSNDKPTITVPEGVVLTISDSVRGGSVTNTNVGLSAIVNNGTLTIDGGSFDALGTVITGSGDTTVSAGTFSDMSVVSFLGHGAVVKIDVTRDTVGAPVFLASGLDATVEVDLNGYDYTIAGSPVGSGSNKSQAMHLEAGNTFTIRNGGIEASGVNNLKILIQNYCDLTIDSVDIDATGVIDFVLSNNSGSVEITGTTSISNASEVTAIDAAWWPSAYPEGTDVIIDTTGTITGDIEIGFYGKNNTAEDPMPFPSQTVLTIESGVFTGEIVIIEGASYGEDYSTGLTPEQMDAMALENVQVLGGAFGASSFDFALEHVVAGKDISVTGEVEIADVTVPYGITVTLVEGTKYTGAIRFEGVPTLGGTYASTSGDVITLAGVTAGASGFVMDSEGITGDVSAGQLTVAGDMDIRSRLTLADGAKIVVPVGSTLNIDAGSTLSGGDVINYGNIEVGGTLASDVDNQEGASVDAAVDAVISGEVSGEGDFDQVKPTISDLYDQTCDLGGSISVPFTVSDGASVTLSGAAWASISNGKIVGTPTSAGTWIIVATPAVGDNAGDAKHFVVVVSAPEASDPTPGPVTDDEDDGGLDLHLILWILIGILIVLMILKMIF